MNTLALEPQTEARFEFLPAFLAAMQALASFILKVVWSDEAVAIFGNSFFYPLVASTLFIITVALMPAGIVKRCQCYCARKLRYLTRVVQINGRRLYSKIAFLIDALQLKNSNLLERPAILGSARVIVGTLFTLSM